MLSMSCPFSSADTDPLHGVFYISCKIIFLKCQWVLLKISLCPRFWLTTKSFSALCKIIRSCQVVDEVRSISQKSQMGVNGQMFQFPCPRVGQLSQIIFAFSEVPSGIEFRWPTAGICSLTTRYGFLPFSLFHFPAISSVLLPINCIPSNNYQFLWESNLKL